LSANAQPTDKNTNYLSQNFCTATENNVTKYDNLTFCATQQIFLCSYFVNTQLGWLLSTTAVKNIIQVCQHGQAINAYEICGENKGKILRVFERFFWGLLPFRRYTQNTFRLWAGAFVVGMASAHSSCTRA
jgi:hypothetical protein